MARFQSEDITHGGISVRLRPIQTFILKPQHLEAKFEDTRLCSTNSCGDSQRFIVTQERLQIH